jgi:Raf kinase inhibitor-like YbhB/YbcL family protein
MRTIDASSAPRAIARRTAFALAMLIATGSGFAAQRGETSMPLTISSSAFKHNETIPRRYSCEGEDISPPLQWTGVPPGTRSLALIVDDPDAPDPKAPRMTWVHWVLYNIPPSANRLEEAVATLPGGTAQGTNDWNRTGYGGPCPPIGRHRYLFKLYALDTELPDLQQPDKAGLEQAMQGRIVGEAVLIGSYEKER